MCAQFTSTCAQSDPTGSSKRVQAQVMHCFAWGIPQGKVAAMVDGDDGKPLYHGVVDRLYTRLRTILQTYMLGKQEDERPYCTASTDSMRE